MQKEALAAGEVLADPAAYEDEFKVGVGVCDRGAGLHVDIVTDRDKIAAQLEVCRILCQVLVHNGFYTMIGRIKRPLFSGVTICDNVVTK